jgi:hypothetical protein
VTPPTPPAASPASARTWLPPSALPTTTTSPRHRITPPPPLGRVTLLPGNMDISPPAGLPPPRLRPEPPPAATHSPVARRPLAAYLVREPPSWRAHGFPPGYPLTRAVELAAGDKSIPPELLPRLCTVLQETRLAGGLYLRDVVRLALGDCGDTPPPPRPSGPTVAPPGSRRKQRAVRLPGVAPAPVDPALPAALPRALTQLSLPPSPPRIPPERLSGRHRQRPDLSRAPHRVRPRLVFIGCPGQPLPISPGRRLLALVPLAAPSPPTPSEAAQRRPVRSCSSFPTMTADGTSTQLFQRRPGPSAACAGSVMTAPAPTTSGGPYAHTPRLRAPRPNLGAAPPG